MKATEPKTISSMNPNPPKASGMPRGLKIFMIFLCILCLGAFVIHTFILVKVPPQPPVVQIQPTQKVAFHKGDVITAKCKDFKDIGLYLESDMSVDDFNTTLSAVATIPSTALVIPNQELTFKSISPNLKIHTKLKVYKCQVSKNVLMGKIVTISKTPM